MLYYLKTTYNLTTIERRLQPQKAFYIIIRRILSFFIKLLFQILRLFNIFTLIINAFYRYNIILIMLYYKGKGS